MKARKPKVGIFGIGLAAYWPQFKGLRGRLVGSQREVEKKISAWAEVVSGGLVDTAEKSVVAGETFQREGVSLVFCYVGTYSTSSQVVPAVQIPGAPVVILNLQPVAQLDYERTTTSKWLEACQACCVPEIACAFARCDITFHVVTGMLREEKDIVEPARRAWCEIEEWCVAAGAVGQLARARMGFLGQTYPGMMDLYSDFTQHHAQLKTHIEVLEMCDLKERVDRVTAKDCAAKRRETMRFFEISGDSAVDPLARKPTKQALDWACRVAVGLDRLVADYDLDGLAYYYRGRAGNEYERLGSGMGLGCSLLTGRGIPCSGEGDLKNCQAMKIMDLIGAGGSYTEIVAMDFRDEVVLMGHDGPFHIAIAEGKPTLRGLTLYHGKRGSGIGVEARVKQGPVTILGLTQTREGNLKFIGAQGESVSGHVLQLGNTESRLKFPLGVTDFVNRWSSEAPTHHCALGVGHRLSTLRKVMRLLKLPLVEVCP